MDPDAMILPVRCMERYDPECWCRDRDAGECAYCYVCLQAELRRTTLPSFVGRGEEVAQARCCDCGARQYIKLMQHNGLYVCAWGCEGEE